MHCKAPLQSVPSSPFGGSPHVSDWNGVPPGVFAASPFSNAGGPGSKGMGKGLGGVAAMGGGASGGKGAAGQPPLPSGPVPNLSLAEAKQLAELSQKAGGSAAFKRYSDLAKHLENAQKPPPAVSPQTKLQQADSA
eukprot:7309935-Pyramimonas_sp.AAC.1